MTQLELTKDSNYTDPELAEILKKSGPGAALSGTTDIPALRKTLLERKRALTAANQSSTSSEIKEADCEIDTRDGSKIVVRVYQGPKSNGGPALVMLHGGGFCLGGLDNEALLCRNFCNEFGGVSVNVDYRLSPEFKFPIPVFDCYDALKWTAANADKIGADLNQGFIVGGISAGGNISAVVSHLYRDERLQPPLTGVYLSIPSTIDADLVPEKYKADHKSRDENKDAPILNEGAVKLFRDNYAGDPSSPLMSPMLFETGQKGLPPTYFQICGLDPLRDDALIYERILREECGIETKMDLYPGLPHGFWSWWPTAQFSVKQQKDCVEGLRWLLEAGKRA